MDYSIIYRSGTGNTAMLARAIRQVLPEDNCLHFGEPEKKPCDSPLVFVGFWTDKGTCDEGLQGFLKTLKGKKIFLFGTAGFAGDEGYYQTILEAIKQHIDPSNEIIGTFMCRGEMSIAVRMRYEGMLDGTEADEKIKLKIENFDRALSHPDQSDCDQLKREVLKVYEAIIE